MAGTVDFNVSIQPINSINVCRALRCAGKGKKTARVLVLVIALGRETTRTVLAGDDVAAKSRLRWRAPDNNT